MLSIIGKETSVKNYKTALINSMNNYTSEMKIILYNSFIHVQITTVIFIIIFCNTNNCVESFGLNVGSADVVLNFRVGNEVIQGIFGQ